MRKITAKTFLIISLIWIISIFFLYFLAIRTSASDCQGSICFNIPRTNLVITNNHNHIYYIESLKRIIERYTFEDEPRIKMNPSLAVLSWVFLIYLIYYVYVKILKGREKLTITIRPIYFLVLFLIIFYLTYSRFIIYYNINASGPALGIVFSSLSFLAKALLIIFPMASFGKKLKNFLIPPENNYVGEIVISFAFGFLPFVFSLFALGLFNLLTPLYIWLILGLFLVFSYQQFFSLLKEFFANKTLVKMNYFSPVVFLLVVFFILASCNLVDILRPYPIGFDDLEYYMSNVKLIADQHGLISGIMPYSWELFLSSGMILFKSITVSFVMSFIAGIMLILSLYTLIKNFGFLVNLTKKNITSYAIFGSVLFYTLPSVIFQSSKDQKTDLAALFFLSVGFLFLLRWFKEKKIYKSPAIKYLYISAIFIGMALSIKVTAIFFIIAVFVSIVYFLIKSKTKLKNVLGMAVFSLVLLILPAAPFYIRNIAETKSLSIANIQSGKTSFSGFSVFDGDKQKRSGANAELERYTGFYDKAYKKYLLLPFNTTFNWKVYGTYTDTGYLFLMVIPIGLLAYFLRTKEKNIYASLILISGIVYWLLWSRFGFGVIWYGYGGFLFSILALIYFYELFSANREYKILHKMIGLFAILWFFADLFLRTAYIPQYVNTIVDPSSIYYARGSFSEKDYFNERYGNYEKFLSIINKDISDNPDNPPKVLKAGTYMKYFISKNNLIVVSDNTLDIFASIYDSSNEQKTIQQLKNKNIKYIVYDEKIKGVDFSSDQPIVKNLSALTEFIKNNPDSFSTIEDGKDSGYIAVALK